jgi:ADP-heptose:LPS heptosyltransferase
LGLGDEIMASAWARRAISKNPDAKIFIGPEGKPEWSTVWENNPNIYKPEQFKRGEPAVWVPHYTGHRPYIKGITPGNLIYNDDHRCEPGDIFLTEKEIEPFRQYAGSILIEPHIKGSFSGNKAWFWDRWQQVANGLKNVVQIGDRHRKSLQGVKRIHTGDFRQALAVVSQASLVITTDGALHHAAAALGRPAVVLWGARTHPKILGYDSHVNLYTGHGESCGSMVSCQHCMDAMKRISVEMVLEAVREASRNMVAA